MTNRKSTKRALLGSVMAMVLCLAMLVGATFAWFTDTASTGVNKIQAGNLDVKLMYSTDMQTWKEATEETKLFNDDALWEPGYTQVVYLKVVNNGNLALKYETKVNDYSRGERGKNADGKLFYLDQYLKAGAAEIETAFATREDAQNAVAASAQTLTKGMQLSDGWAILKAGEESKPFAVVIYMPATVGNEANSVVKSRVATIKDIGLMVRATQAPVESDSFNNTYDETAYETSTKPVSYSFDTHTITGNIWASGKYGVIQAAGGKSIQDEDGTVTVTPGATLNVNVNTVRAEENDGYAVAVWASGYSTVVINSGDFTQEITGSSNQYDLIYASDNAQIVINGGTFKCATPQWTLNCADGSNAHITVNGGSFYKYNPAESTSGAGEVVLGDGYHVVQNGDWYTVVAD